MRAGAPILLALMACIAGCNDRSSLALWRDDFETECGGAPCGWTQIAGPSGAATWVETLPSEHGVRLQGAGVAIARMTPDHTVPLDTAHSMEAHVVARCDAGAQLTIIVTLRTAPTTIDVSGSAAFPPSWDGTRMMPLTLSLDATHADAQFDAILGVILHKEGPGACEVDYVSLADSTTHFFE